MLARHAEDLFWIGRYLERAEDTARLLDVTFHGVLEAGLPQPGGEPWRDLLEALYLDDAYPTDGGLTAEAVAPFLVSDRSHPGSILSLLGRARDNARAVREWLSTEMWEAINGVYLELRARRIEWELRDRPYDLCRAVKVGCQTVVGASVSSMPRGEGYRFLGLGQMLERAALTARILEVWVRRDGGEGGSTGFPEWVQLLKSVSAYEAYLREHRASMQAERVLEFLLQSPDLPRSVLFCLRVCETHLQRLARPPYGAVSLRRAGRVRSDVEFSEPTAFSAAGLRAFLVEVQRSVIELGSAIEADYFRPRSDFALHVYEAF